MPFSEKPLFQSPFFKKWGPPLVKPKFHIVPDIINLGFLSQKIARRIAIKLRVRIDLFIVLVSLYICMFVRVRLHVCMPSN